MIRRHRIAGAREAREVGADRIGRGGRGRHREDRAGALAIEAEGLGAGDGNQRLGHDADQVAKAGDILVEATAETLIGEIDERQQAALGDDGGKLHPLCFGNHAAARVVAARMQQYGVAGRGSLQRGDHVVEEHRLRWYIEERVAGGFKAGRLEDARMVRPARQADPDALAAHLMDEVGCEPESTGTPRRLHAGNVAAIDGVAADQRPEMIDKDEVAFRADIGLAVLRGEKPLFRFLDRAEDRRVACLVAVDADAEIDLSGARVLAIKPDQGQQRIVGLAGQCVEHAGKSPLNGSDALSVENACRPPFLRLALRLPS
ncbi:hypothetical protein D9M72_361990 [compost metagenome]